MKETRRVRWIALWSMLMVAALVLGGCGGATAVPPTKVVAPTPTEKVVVDRPLVVALLADPENLDPHQYDSSNAYYVIGEVFEGLVRHPAGSAEIEPALAEKWEMSEDGLQYTFTLRHGVTFHDGTPFNAEAVKFNFNRQADANNPYYSMGAFWYWAAYMWPVTAVDVVDEFTVRYTLSQPYAYFMEYLCGGMGMMVSPAAVEKYGEDFVQNPVGTGPYKFAKWDKGQQIVLEANDGYWGAKPAITQVVFRPIPEEASKMASMLTGEVHLALEIGPVAKAQLEASSGHKVFTAPTGSIWFMSMNVKQKPFDDVRVRRAIAHAINKESIVHNILKDTADVAQGPIAPAYKCYNPDITVYEYNPEKAKALLAEAGYADGLKVVFDVPQSGSGMQLPVEMATEIQANLAAVGIDAKIEITEFNTWMDRIRTPEVQLAEMSWNVSPAVEDDILSNVFSEPGLPPEGFNTSWYANDQVLALLKEAGSIADVEERCKGIREAQKLITDDAPAVFVDHARLVYGLDARLEGFSPTLDGILRLWSASWRE
jgi:peptide/nickel transport system substrate-binding protein